MKNNSGENPTIVFFIVVLRLIYYYALLYI